MLKNFLLSTVRNLLKNRTYSVINVSGLAIGIACTILILLWVKDETGYDRFIPKHDKLYQTWLNAEFDGKINSWLSVPLPLYEALKTADHHVVNTAVVSWNFDHLLTVGENKITDQGLFVSEEFLEMLEYELISGNADQVLDNPASIVLTESMAKRLFGNEDPVGKSIRLDNAADVQVTGILKDIPGNSTMEFEFLVPWKQYEIMQEFARDNQDNWGNNSFQVIVELDDPANEQDVEASVENIIQENSDEEDFPRMVFLHPMNDWHLRGNFENGVASGGMIDYVQLLSVIAAFILMIACINFMNLATARSEKRAKEVGIRKSIGSSRSSITLHFLGESVFISTLAFLLAIILAELLLPWYNMLVDKSLFIDYFSVEFLVYSLTLILITGVLAGSYPAFYLSSFNPVKTLKGTIATGKAGSTPRKVLVVFQFGISILLMIGTVVIYKQIEMVKDRELGYEQENLITVDFTDELRKVYDVMKTELLQSGAVESMTRANSAITSINSNNFLDWPGKPEEQKVLFATITCEYDWAKTMGVEVIMGRDFSKEFKSDSSAIVINKKALSLMDLEDPIGTELSLWGQKRKLVGVVDDVLMGSLYEDVRPMFAVLMDWGGTATLRLARNKNVEESLATVKTIFEKHNPAYPFEYEFTDEAFARKFKTINLTQRLAGIFSVLAIIITGLGLFGMAIFMAEQKAKEISIRKVLGATVNGLVSMMSKDFAKLVVFSLILFGPIGYFGMNQYMERYPLRVDISWWIFPLVGLFALVFALVIVMQQAYKAAVSNPVDKLRGNA